MTAPSDRPLSYAAAGVDIAAADATVARYRAIAARTWSASSRKASDAQTTTRLGRSSSSR